MLLHLHHVLDPCGFTVLYLHQSSGSGRHFGKCIGVDGWLLSMCVCVCASVSLPFQLVCLWRFSVYVMDQEHERTIASGTERTANRSSSSSTITNSNSSNISVGGFGKLQRPETRNQGPALWTIHPSIYPNPQCPIRRRHFLKPACTSRTIYIHSSHRPGPEPVLKPRPAQAASLVCGFVQADFFILHVKYFQYSQLKLRQLTKVSLENTTTLDCKYNI